MLPLRVVLHISDVHCNLDALEEVLSKEADGVDAVFLSGDLECNGDAVELLKSIGKPVFAVPGNMDDHYVARLLREYGLSVEGEVVDYKGLVVAGVGGREPVSNIMRVRELLRDYKGRPIIVVAHHPPHGLVDVCWSGVHAGLYEARRLLEEVKPLAYLCGHIHEARGVAAHGSTLVVNAGPLAEGYYALVDLERGIAELKRLW